MTEEQRKMFEGFIAECAYAKPCAVCEGYRAMIAKAFPPGSGEIPKAHQAKSCGALAR